MKTWRGEAAEDIEELAIAVEGKAEPVEVKDEAGRPKVATPEAAAEKKAAARKAAPTVRRNSTTKKPTPPAK